jgi:hypothetical protein
MLSLSGGYPQILRRLHKLGPKGFLLLLVRLRNLRLISRQAKEAFAKLNYAAAWPSVVRNGSAFPFQWPLGSGLCPL